jgi:uridylate kinase
MKNIVIKLGGSLFSTSDENLIDYEFLAKFRASLEKYIEQDYKFAIIVGGGWLCRKYQQMAQRQKEVDDDLHQIGVATINLNAVMIRSLWSDISDEKVLRYDDYENLNGLELERPLLIGAAGNPGHSSDFNSVLVAKAINAHDIIRLTDVDGIYDADPDNHPEAQRYKKLSWQKYREVLGIKEHKPGAHYPIDPIAAKLSEEAGLNFYVINGNNLENFEAIIEGKEFDGTIVSNANST